MKVQIGNKEFFVNWTHESAPKEGWRDNISHSTFCTIKEWDIILSKEGAFCSKRDQFNKNKGRKTSLARALEEIIFMKDVFPNNTLDDFKEFERKDAQNSLEKPFRKLFWIAYHKQSQKEIKIL